MASKEEKKKRRQLVREMARREFEEEAKEMPISKEDLRELFDHLDRPDPPPCDHTLGDTIAFLEKRNLNKGKIVPWLQSYGGYCDCEVIFNVDEKWGEYVGRIHEDGDE